MQNTSSLDTLKQLFDNGHELSYQDIKHKLNIGERQARRLIKDLQQLGVPIRTQNRARQKVFSVPADQQQITLSDISLDTSEIKALAIAAKASRSLLVDTPHGQALHTAFEKLLEKVRPITYVFDVDESMQDWFFDENYVDQLSLDNFQKLDLAITERRSVRIEYLTAKDQRVSTDRKIDPYFFAKRQRAWLLIAYCHQRKEIRNFAIARISGVVLCNEREENAFFSMPDLQPDSFFCASLGSITNGECYVLRLLVEPEKALYFRQRTYQRTQQIEKEYSDGRIEVSFEVEGLEEMRSFCQGWGVGITVLEPEELRLRLKQEAEELLKRYSESDKPDIG